MTPPPCVTCKYRKKLKCFHTVCEPTGIQGVLCTTARHKYAPEDCSCGPEGKLWEPRQSWMDRIIKRVRG